MKRNDFYPVSGERTHQNCHDHTGVYRPGKTAHDKARGVWEPRGTKARAATARYEDSISKRK